MKSAADSEINKENGGENIAGGVINKRLAASQYLAKIWRKAASQRKQQRSVESEKRESSSGRKA